jgi:hypothetical protein
MDIYKNPFSHIDLWRTKAFDELQKGWGPA